jgi:hypothetical protein
MEDRPSLALKKLARMMKAVGSRVTCQPPPMDTDADWLVLVEPGNLTKFINTLLDEGYELGGSHPGNEVCLPAESGFSSFKKGIVNIILTEDLVFYTKFLAATHLAARFNLLKKEDRVALFQAVLYGV